MKDWFFFTSFLQTFSFLDKSFVFHACIFLVFQEINAWHTVTFIPIFIIYLNSLLNITIIFKWVFQFIPLSTYNYYITLITPTNICVTINQIKRHKTLILEYYNCRFYQPLEKNFKKKEKLYIYICG